MPDGDRPGRAPHRLARDREAGAFEGEDERGEGAPRGAREGARRAPRDLDAAAREVVGREGGHPEDRADEGGDRAHPAGGGRGGTRGQPAEGGRAPLRPAPAAREGARRAERPAGGAPEGRADAARGGHRGGHRRRRVALDRRPCVEDAGERETAEAPPHGRPARPAGDRAARGRDRGFRRRPALPGGALRPAPADRLVYLRRPDRRRQDGARPGARGVPVRRRARDGSPRHVRVHGEALRRADDRRAAGLRRLRGGRPSDGGDPAAALLRRPVRRDREGASGRLQRAPPGPGRRPADRRQGPRRLVQEHRDHHDVEPRVAVDRRGVGDERGRGERERSRRSCAGTSGRSS